MAKKATKAKAEPTGPRVRNQGIRRVRVTEIEDNPWNFREHTEEQEGTLEGTVEEIGWYGYPDVYETDEGKLRLCDGHLRKKHLLERYGADVEIEVNVTDFDEQDALKALATHDPIAAMAATDPEKLEAIAKELDVGSEALQELLDQLVEDAGIIPPQFEPATGEEQGNLDEKKKTKCPECGHEF